MQQFAKKRRHFTKNLVPIPSLILKLRFVTQQQARSGQSISERTLEECWSTLQRVSWHLFQCVLSSSKETERAVAAAGVRFSNLKFGLLFFFLVTRFLVWNLLRCLYFVWIFLIVSKLNRSKKNCFYVICDFFKWSLK